MRYEQKDPVLIRRCLINPKWNLVLDKTMSWHTWVISSPVLMLNQLQSLTSYSLSSLSFNFDYFSQVWSFRPYVFGLVSCSPPQYGRWYSVRVSCRQMTNRAHRANFKYSHSFSLDSLYVRHLKECVYSWWTWAESEDIHTQNKSVGKRDTKPTWQLKISQTAQINRLQIRRDKESEKTKTRLSSTYNYMASIDHCHIKWQMHDTHWYSDQYKLSC